MTTDQASTDTLAVLRSACTAVGIDPHAAELLNLSENAVYRLPGAIVARVSRPGQVDAARREANVAGWLERSGVQAVQLVPSLEQPVIVNDRAVTFWKELPPHHHGSPAQVAAALKQLHAVAPPASFKLGHVAPFVRLSERIDTARGVTEDSRRWLREHLVDLHERWADLPEGLPWCVIHGDAWVGNVVATDDGHVIVLDLERTSLGPPEWDLVHTAIKWLSFGWITKDQYAEFCAVYGHDVTTWAGFELLRDIREFRMTTMAVQAATADHGHQAQAQHRLACIRGERGPRPWAGWEPLG
ncbi:phosphotransferase family protein [Nocardia sp. R16R-3T]